MTEPNEEEHGACPADMVVGEDGRITVDAVTQARLEALLEAAGIGQLSTTDGKALADPDVLHRLTSTVSYALDEAAAALSRLRAETGNQGQLRSLPEACSDGDVATVRKLLKEGQSVHETSEDGESLLSLACSAGYYELAEVLLSMHASTEEPSPKGGCTPLMEASSGGFADVVKLLLVHGAEVNAVSNAENTALMLACCGGHEDIVKLLIEAGADLELQNESGHTPLMEAASGGHVGVAKILLENGAGINTHSDEYKESALTLACYKGHFEMVQFLLEAGADQEHKTDEMHTALMEASMDGHVDVARLLLDSGAQVNMPSDSFESPLTLAACGGHVALAALLVSRGANLEEINDEGYTPLMEAAREGHEEVVSLLISHGANVNAITEETRETALTLAACGGFMECCKLLIEGGAELELGCTTPLMEAAQEGHVDLIHYFVEQGAKVDFQSSSGSTALSHACEHGRTDAADVLLSLGAALEHESEGGRTPLMKACRCGHLCTVQYLLSRGANLNKMTRSKDHTALSLACLSGHASIVELLLLRGANPSVKLKDESNVFLEACKGGQVSIVRTLLDLPRLPNVPSYPPMETVSQTKSPEEELPSRVPTQTLPIVVPPQEPDSASPTSEKKSNLPASDESSVNSCVELSELEERIKKIIETNVKLKVESKQHLQAIQSNEDSRLLKKQRILEQLQKVEVDLQGKAAQQLRNCLNCVDFDSTKMMERDVPDGCDLASEERDFSDGEVENDKCRHGVDDNEGNVSPAASTFSLGKTSTYSDDYETIFDVNGCTETNNDTALTLAAAAGHVDVVLLLLKKNAKIEHRDKKGFTPLILAATGGHAQVVSELLDAGAHIESQSERTKDTPLSLACSSGRIFVVQTLVERGANIEHRNVSDYTPLSLAASGGFVNVIELLLHAGAEINSRTGSKLGISPLMLAAMNGHTAAVLTLLDMGADINAQIETNRNTALTLACFQGRHEVVTILVERRANVEHRAKTGLTPLMEAASGGYAEVGKVLLDKGSDPNAPPVPSSKDTALTIAADKGHLRFCELILARGAIVDARNKKGNTSFWLACNGGYLDVAKLLVQHGADINAVDNRNVTPLMAAFRRGHVKVVKWLSKMVKHFPTDSECIRYMSSVTDRDLLKRCHVCAESIATAKERQGQQADKVMSALLEELDKEKTREEQRREKALRKREKRKKKRQERQTSAKPDEPAPSNDDRTTDPSSNDSKESRVKYLVAEPESKVKEINNKPSKPTVTRSIPQQPLTKKQQHRKDEEWKEVVRKSKRVSVPSNLIARIIGRGGCNINAIREETGAHIDINRQKKGLDRTITIRGPNNAIRHADFLITELMKDENSNKDIASIFQTVKKDKTNREEHETKKRPNPTPTPSPEIREVTPNLNERVSPAPKATSEQKKQIERKCNTPISSEISASNHHVPNTNDQLKQPEVPIKLNQITQIQSSVANDAPAQFNSKLPNKTVNRPVQPVAPMIATTPKNVQAQTTQMSNGLKTISRVEMHWQQNHKQPSQHQVVAGVSNLNLSDPRQMYPTNNISGRSDNEHGLDSNTFHSEANRPIMHSTNQTGHEVSGLEASYNAMSNNANAMQQRKMWPIGTERAIHQRRTTPVCEPMLDSRWTQSYWDFEGRMGQLWLNQQPSNMHLSEGSQYFPREHPNSSTGMHMMLGGNMISQMSGVPNDYNNSQQRLQAERNMGVPHLTGFPMTGRQSAQTQASTHFAREGMHVNTPFPSQEAPVGQVSGVSNSSPWPFMDRQVKIPVHPGRSPVEPIGHMKQSKGIPMENRSPNFSMSGMQMQSPGMHMSTASDGSGSIVHGGSSGSASYLSPDCNPIWNNW